MEGISPILKKIAGWIEKNNNVLPQCNCLKENQVLFSKDHFHYRLNSNMCRVICMCVYT